MNELECETVTTLPDGSHAQVTETVDRLAERFGPVKWKPSQKPVDELVATILSQNTSDTNTARAFASLRARFPTWASVVEADVGDVADSIKSGGLSNIKAPRIQAVLREIIDTNVTDQNAALLQRLKKMQLDNAQTYLTSLRGIGPKTAACVLLFAVGLPAIPVDTHVHRVSTRLGLLEPGVTADRAHVILREIVPAAVAYAFHVYLIRHGRETCRARKPNCESCVLNDYCKFFQMKAGGDY